MSISYLFSLLLTLLLNQGCWGGEETKNVSCASLRTGNAYKYCVKEKEKPKRVEWQSVFSNKTSTWLASWLCQHKNTTQTHNVIDVNYSCITLLDCVNVDHTAISARSEHLTHFNVSGASDEPKKPLEKEPDSENTTADGDHPDRNRGDTSLIWKIIVGVALGLVIAGLLLVLCYVYKSRRDKQCNQGHRDVEAGQGIPEPNSIPLMQNEQRDASDQGGEPGEESRQPMDNEETGADNPLLNGDASGQGEEGVLGMEDGKLSDNDRADTEICQKTHADSHPLNVPKVVRVNSQTDDPQLLGQPQSNGHVPYRRVNDETKEATPGAQSPGPPQMNGGPPMSNRAAEETTALLDKQALDKDQVTKPPELIDKGPNDMESSRGEL
ncbi:uncharacterized protein LOC110539179 [Oncorhynchus mykiss]|uniref:uncharacterized protein LOC110539179 n=1 Tax=Oncorhynchus mykiss TaxID=8022 RepID=UPI001877EFC9|nr:uncharacterized protein LOC110539179 [Oncorhynchus mykiss]